VGPTPHVARPCGFGWNFAFAIRTPVIVGGGLGVGVAVGVAVGLGVGFGVGLGVGFGVGLGVTLGVGDGEGLGLGDGESDGNGEGDGDGLGLGDGEGLGLGKGDGDGLGLGAAQASTGSWLGSPSTWIAEATTQARSSAGPGNWIWSQLVSVVRPVISIFVPGSTSASSWPLTGQASRASCAPLVPLSA
jgi:hypothetical protein